VIFVFYPDLGAGSPPQKRPGDLRGGRQKSVHEVGGTPEVRQ